MTHMWRGPCTELVFARSDPLFPAITRRLAEHGVFFDIEYHGRTARAFALEKSRGEWFRVELGETSGRDPWDCVLRLSHDHTPFDAAVIGFRVEYLCRRLEDFIRLGRKTLKLESALDDLLGALHGRS